MPSPWAALLPLQAPLLLLLLSVGSTSATNATAATAGTGKSQQRLLAQLAGELSVNRMVRLLMLQPAEGTSPWAAAPMLRNTTLRPIFAAVDRCAWDQNVYGWWLLWGLGPLVA